MLLTLILQITREDHLVREAINVNPIDCPRRRPRTRYYNVNKMKFPRKLTRTTARVQVVKVGLDLRICFLSDLHKLYRKSIFASFSSFSLGTCTGYPGTSFIKHFTTSFTVHITVPRSNLIHVPFSSLSAG